MSTINVVVGAKEFSLNVADEFRFPNELTGGIAKILGVPPGEILSRKLRLKIEGGADLNNDESLNAQGIHLGTLDAGLADQGATEGQFQPSNHPIAQEKV